MATSISSKATKMDNWSDREMSNYQNEAKKNRENMQKLKENYKIFKNEICVFFQNNVQTRYTYVTVSCPSSIAGEKITFYKDVVILLGRGGGVKFL